MYSLHLTDTKSTALREPRRHQETLVWYIILPQQPSFRYKSGPHCDRREISSTASVTNTPCWLPERMARLKSQGDGSSLNQIFSPAMRKTDNIIIQQTFMAVEQGAECLSAMADDTDVYILLLHYYNQKEFNIPMFMESSVHRRQTTDIRATAKEHANILPNLLAAHGLSGRDTVAPCYGIGKMKILKNSEARKSFFKLSWRFKCQLARCCETGNIFHACPLWRSKTRQHDTGKSKSMGNRVGRGWSTMLKLCSLPPTDPASMEKTEKGTSPDMHILTCTLSQCPWPRSCTTWVD